MVLSKKNISFWKAGILFSSVFHLFSISYCKLAPRGKDSQSYVYEKSFNGEDVVAVVKFYQCHLPASVSLSIIIVSSDITWKSPNLTSDIPKKIPLGKNFILFQNLPILSPFYIILIHVFWSMSL